MTKSLFYQLWGRKVKNLFIVDAFLEQLNHFVEGNEQFFVLNPAPAVNGKLQSLFWPLSTPLKRRKNKNTFSRSIARVMISIITFFLILCNRPKAVVNTTTGTQIALLVF